MLEDQQIIRSIINVNYAGEFGAISLYSGQLFIARLLHLGMMNIIRIFDTMRESIAHCSETLCRTMECAHAV